MFTNLDILFSVSPFDVAGLAFGVTGLAFNLYGVLAKDSTIEEINNKLTELQTSVALIQDDIGSIINRLDHLINLVAYHDDYSRLLNYFCQYTDYLDFNREIEQSWLDTVLGHGSDGLDHTIRNFNRFISGSTLSTSVLLSYEGVLIEEHSRDSDSYFEKLTEFVDYILTLQGSGYAMLIAANKIKNRTYSHIQQRLEKQLYSQKDIVRAFNTQWPSGRWGLLQSESGCPVNINLTWLTGSRRQSTESYGNNENDWKPVNHFMPLENTIVEHVFFFFHLVTVCMTQNFCMTASTVGNNEWPRGTYCIFAFGGCPNRFDYCPVKWDDYSHLYGFNKNAHSGSLPTGIYNTDTTIWYCCRSDGSVNDEIILPTQKPFYLMRYGNQCQKVCIVSKTSVIGVC